MRERSVIRYGRLSVLQPISTNGAEGCTAGNHFCGMRHGYTLGLELLLWCSDVSSVGTRLYSTPASGLGSVSCQKFRDPITTKIANVKNRNYTNFQQASRLIDFNWKIAPKVSNDCLRSILYDFRSPITIRPLFANFRRSWKTRIFEN